MYHIREIEAADWPDVWQIIEPVFRRGDTYAVSSSITEDEARALWLELPEATFVAADDDGAILGVYYIKPNHAGGGAHVCNCGYITGENARGRGVASAMCTHSQQQAVARGFGAMQFNFVVSTNETAISLWRRHGFEVVGTLPGAFLHPDRGYVDAFVIYKRLDTRSAQVKSDLDLHKVAYHEAARAVVALSLGLAIAYATIEGDDKPEGSVRGPGVVLHDHSDRRQNHRAVRETIVHLLAGGEVAKRIDPAHDPEKSSRDEVAARNLLSEDPPPNCSCVGDDVFLAEMERLRKQARKEVRRLWLQIDALANQLMHRRTMPGDEVVSYLVERFGSQWSA